MQHHPYHDAPAHRFWRLAVAQQPPNDIDPVIGTKFQIRPADKVATAGSCFAQHLARHLATSGFNYFITEEKHPVIPDHLAAGYNYGTFTARYGNIYTARQLTQVLLRAYDQRTPADDIWRTSDQRLIDPYRPQIQPSGFANDAEFSYSRRQHFAAIRRMVEEMDVFVFTLGLTEAWIDTVDGSVFPVCPGVAGGSFDASRHRLKNFKVGEVIADMNEAFDFIRARNPKIRFLLTVSPVPLVATAEDCHVLAATTYSKSVLRVACEELSQARDDIAYFPSYEIITGSYNRGRYFAADLRSVTEEGVEHVMRVFLKHYAHTTDTNDSAGTERPIAQSVLERTPQSQGDIVERAIKVECDELAYDR